MVWVWVDGFGRSGAALWVSLSGLSWGLTRSRGLSRGDLGTCLDEDGASASGAVAAACPGPVRDPSVGSVGLAGVRSFFLPFLPCFWGLVLLFCSFLRAWGCFFLLRGGPSGRALPFLGRLLALPSLFSPLGGVPPGVVSRVLHLARGGGGLGLGVWRGCVLFSGSPRPNLRLFCLLFLFGPVWFALPPFFWRWPVIGNQPSGSNHQDQTSSSYARCYNTSPVDLRPRQR